MCHIKDCMHYKKCKHAFSECPLVKNPPESKFLDMVGLLHAGADNETLQKVLDEGGDTRVKENL